VLQFDIDFLEINIYHNPTIKEDIQTISSKKSADYIHNITTNIGQIKSYKNWMSLILKNTINCRFHC